MVVVVVVVVVAVVVVVVTLHRLNINALLSADKYI